MLTVIAMFHLSFPGFAPVEPPYRPVVHLHPTVACRLCVMRPIMIRRR